MPVVDVVNLDGKKVGQVELADAIFGAKVNQHLLHEASRWYLRGLRRGTHKVKEKSEVSGAGRKLWKQKGTGRARVGSMRSPLSAKLAEQRLTVVDAWTLETHKTKSLLAVLGKLNHKKSALLVAHGENSNLERASRNVQGVTLAAPNVLQPYDVLKHDLLVLSKEAVARLSHSLDPEKKPVVVPDVETIAPAAKPVKKEAAPKAAAKKPAAAKKAAKPAKKKGKG